MSRTRERGAGARGAVARQPAALTAALALAGALATGALAGCTWDPHAAQRSSSASGAASQTSAPAPSSVSHEVTPSGASSAPSSGQAPAARPTPSASPTRSSSGPSSTPSPSRSFDPFGSASGGPRPAPDQDVAGGFDPALSAATGGGTGDEVGTLADLGLSGHDGFDRVVLELEGPDVPAWEVRYVPRALGDPNGQPVAVAGDAVLQILLQPVAYPESGSAPYAGPRRVTAPGTTAVSQVVVSTFFEGELQVFVGVDGERRPFRAYGMTDPARVVVEVERP